MVGTETDGIMSRIEEAFASRESMQSPLYRWMMSNHDGFSAVLARAASEGKRPDWADLSRRFAEGGLTDGAGKVPNAASARRTWWRVKRRHAQLHGGGRGAAGTDASAADASPQGGAGGGSGTGRRGEPSAQELLSGVIGEMNRRSGR